MFEFLRGLKHWIEMFSQIVFAAGKKARYDKVVRKAASAYDMIEAPSEDYFRDRYMYILERSILSNSIRKFCSLDFQARYQTKPSNS